MNQKRFAVLILLVTLSRVPFLPTGFGADADAWRVANSALQIWNEGTYGVSRFPGFPLYEFVNAPIIGIGGSPASNVATLLVFLLSLIALKKMLEWWRIPNPQLLLVTVAFFPLLWKNSAITMDYIWGLALILLSTFYFLKRRFLIAGIALGLAAGTRITHLAFVFPFLLLLNAEERRLWFAFGLSAIATTAILYVPVFLSSSYSMTLADYSPGTWHEPMWKIVAASLYRFAYSFGILGLVGVAAVGFVQRRRIMELAQNRAFAFSTGCMTLTVLIFAALPDQREYLIPMIPFLLISLFLLASQRQIIFVVPFLLSLSFVSIDVVEHNSVSPRLGITLSDGIVVKEFKDRLEYDRRKVYVASLDFPDSSMIMIGSGPMFGLENNSVEADRESGNLLRQDVYKAKRNEIYYVYSLNYDQLKEMRGRGFRVYCLDTVGDYLESFIGYRLADEGVAKLSTSLGK